MSTQPKARITPEQYLEIEREAAYKGEYYAGGMFAMSGARETHVLAVTNLAVLLAPARPGLSRPPTDSNPNSASNRWT